MGRASWCARALRGRGTVPIVCTMFHRFRTGAVGLSLLLVAPACQDRGGGDRWATTENTNVDIDWDQINEAYKQADGPEDLERRVNEIYEGSEVISIAVQDVDERQQLVTGFFDRNHSGGVDEGEKIFTIGREVTGPGSAQVQTVGYGPYAYYHSPLLSIASGMMIGSMLSRPFMPGYAPMYRQPYTTGPSRLSSLRGMRSGYRASNPARFGRPSGSGRQYNRVGGGGFRGGGRVGGGRFGVRRPGRTVRPPRLA
jgi:hypothetical protein